MSEFEPITFSVQYTAEDYTHAQQLLGRTPSLFKPKYGWVRHVIVLVLTAAMVTFVLMSRSPASHAAHRHTVSNSVFWNAMSMVVMVVLFIGFWVFLMRQAGRSGKNQTVPVLELTFDEEGHRSSSDTVDSRTRWSHYTRALEDDQMFLLNDGIQIFPIPKRAIPDADTMLRLRTLIENKIGLINGEPRPVSLPLNPPPPA